MSLESIPLAPILSGLFGLYIIAVIVGLIADDRDPTTTLAWILIMVLLPLFGLVLYFFAGRDWAGITLKSQALRDYLAIRNPYMQPIYDRYKVQANALSERTKDDFRSRVISAIDKQNMAPPLPVTSVDVWPSGEAYFPELIADISRAEKSVHMQYFIWEHDELTGVALRACSLERLKAGVEVRMLNDFVGNIQYKKDQLQALVTRARSGQSDAAHLAQGQLPQPSQDHRHRRRHRAHGWHQCRSGVHRRRQQVSGMARHRRRITGPGRAEAAGALRSPMDRGREGVAVHRASSSREWEGDPGAIMTQVVAHGVEDPWKSSSRAYEIAMTAAARSAC